MNGYNPYGQPTVPYYSYPAYAGRQHTQTQAGAPVQAQQPVMPTLCYAKIEEARPYIITAPNASMLFIDREKGKALLKSTDNMYNPYSHYFTFEETDENGNPLKAQQQAQPQTDLSQFAKKEELVGYVTVAQYNEVLTQIEILKGMIAQSVATTSENKANSGNLKQSQPSSRQDK